MVSPTSSLLHRFPGLGFQDCQVRNVVEAVTAIGEFKRVKNQLKLFVCQRDAHYNLLSSSLVEA